MVQKARNDNNGPRVRRGNLDEEEGDDIGQFKFFCSSKYNLFFKAVDNDDGAEYGDSDREGQDDEIDEVVSDKEEESNDEGIGSEGEDITNCTLDNIDNMFENMNADQSDDDMEVDQEELKERRERIRGILKAHTQVQL